MLKPKEPIRRFDIFAEYSRQEAINDGMKLDEAKGYGIWLAKVVAARRFGKKARDASSKRNASAPNHAQTPSSVTSLPWRTLNGVDQTDVLFDQEIVQRMGATFYKTVLVPAISKAIQDGQTYVEIRDKIRRDWKP